MSHDNHSDITALKIEFAEFRGELRAEFKNLAHDVRNLTQKTEAQTVLFVPRREIEQMQAALQGRVSSLEESRSWLIKAIWGAWIAGSATVIAGAAAYLRILAH